MLQQIVYLLQQTDWEHLHNATDDQPIPTDNQSVTTGTISVTIDIKSIAL